MTIDDKTLKTELKASKILKVCRERGQKRAGGISLDEAIAELEALQQHKRCDGCKFHDDVGWDDWCCDCIRKWTIDRYEAKEQ